jgi:hypothetical protein
VLYQSEHHGVNVVGFWISIVFGGWCHPDRQFWSFRLTWRCSSLGALARFCETMPRRTRERRARIPQRYRTIDSFKFPIAVIQESRTTVRLWAICKRQVFLKEMEILCLAKCDDSHKHTSNPRKFHGILIFSATLSARRQKLHRGALWRRQKRGSPTLTWTTLHFSLWNFLDGDLKPQDWIQNLSWNVLPVRTARKWKYGNQSWLSRCVDSMPKTCVGKRTRERKLVKNGGNWNIFVVVLPYLFIALLLVEKYPGYWLLRLFCRAQPSFHLMQFVLYCFDVRIFCAIPLKIVKRLH